ncbi:hypothetical protein [Arenibaculum pallidiluteum]|uniref:hypothetical protein n=1 Tax=Arenibaculum pallidiluteum TaxID=2812559 RepID=UPI001A964B83|nr:hypothetical protein [Arenibaculum pallidiluteum]
MKDRSSIEDLARITTEPAPIETGPEADSVKAAQKAAAMGQVTDPREAARVSAADEGRGGDSDEAAEERPAEGA